MLSRERCLVVGVIMIPARSAISESPSPSLPLPPSTDKTQTRKCTPRELLHFCLGCLKSLHAYQVDNFLPETYITQLLMVWCSVCMSYGAECFPFKVEHFLQLQSSTGNYSSLSRTASGCATTGAAERPIATGV